MITRNETSVPATMRTWNKYEISFNLFVYGRGLPPNVLGLAKAEPMGLLKAVEEVLLGLSTDKELNALLLNDVLFVKLLIVPQSFDPSIYPSIYISLSSLTFYLNPSCKNREMIQSLRVDVIFQGNSTFWRKPRTNQIESRDGYRSNPTESKEKKRYREKKLAKDCEFENGR